MIDNTNFLPARLANVSSVINFVIPFISLGAGLGFLAMLGYAAFTWMTAGDKAENITKAWKIATFAILGLVIVITSFIAVKVIGMVLGTGNVIP